MIDTYKGVDGVVFARVDGSWLQVGVCGHMPDDGTRTPEEAAAEIQERLKDDNNHDWVTASAQNVEGKVDMDDLYRETYFRWLDFHWPTLSWN